MIYRREYPQLRALLERATQIVGDRGRLNTNAGILRMDDGRALEFASVPHDKDVVKYQGRPHDFLGFDEAPQFSRAQYRFLIGWNRTTLPGQRCRVILAGNPPTTPEGRWVVDEWAPWLDEHFPDPAIPGELRWYAILDGKLKWLRSGEEFLHATESGKVERIKPRSRSFIPARLDDNPALRDTGYRAVLQGMPEPLRSQMLYGDFTAGTEDDAWQVIPTAWIRAAQARWTEQPPQVLVKDANGERMAWKTLDALGVDVARGGAAKTVLAPRKGNWFGRLKKYPGTSTPDGPAVVRLIQLALLEEHANAVVNIDVIGVGASVYDDCQKHESGIPNAAGINFAAAVSATDKSGTLSFANLRAYGYWSLREALDPVHGDNLMLPPDPELLADLCAPRWELRARGIQIEAKEDIAERLGRSTDCGDACVLAFVQIPAREAMVWAGTNGSTQKKTVRR